MSLPGIHRSAVLALAVSWVIGAYSALVLESPYRHDDTINRHLPEILRASGQSLAGFISDQISAWARLQGRFFPGGIAWTYATFDAFDSRSSYKLVVAVLLTTAVCAAAMLVAVLTQSWVHAGAFVLIASMTFQIRWWTDGLTSFAGLLTLTTTLTFAALTLLLSKHGHWWESLAGLLYLTALLTYETVIVFAPVMIAVVILVRRNWRPALAIAIPTALQAVGLVLLRILTTATPAPEYTLSFAPRLVAITFTKQLLAALPLSQWWLGHWPVPPVSGLLIPLSFALIGIPVFVGLLIAGSEAWIPPRRPAALIGLVGAWMWVGPSVLISLTRRWQLAMPLGQGYLSVVYEYFGLSLCVLSAWLLIQRWINSRDRDRWGRLCMAFSAVLVATIASLTFAGDLSLLT